MVLRNDRAHSFHARIRPYEVRINGSRRGSFEDVHDAISSARIAKQERPVASIAVADRATGRLVMELAPMKTGI
jgi:hypothetical protein